MTETPIPPRQTAPWLIILLGIIALALAIIIGTQVIGVLYGIVAPPSPPVPSGVAEVSHTSTDYGVDSWVYGTSLDGCEILKFYQDRGASCWSKVDRCPAAAIGGQSSQQTASQDLIQCTSQMSFSIFAMRWNVALAAVGYQQDGSTHFNVDREVFWTGAVPPASGN
ncbi:MAG TPA: hypothetical protein VHO69_05355 [Phototrophicaceae bacterium]|nr:hypothetical protein [Phototrophicaceae bacterium]